MSPITEFDLFFLSYDEPNKELNWADLIDKAPWAKRVDGIKGFSAAHKACALQSETDWFITVDGDNTVREAFFDEVVSLDPERRPNESITWNGVNRLNGLIYGNGGVKLWSKAFVLGGGVGHEDTTDETHSVDFCWQPDYRTIQKPFSDVWVTASPLQAFRVGYREGVKLTLAHGKRIEAHEMKEKLHPINLRNIRIWSSVGGDIENGQWAILGARMGWAAMLDPTFDHTLVRDYDWFDDLWQNGDFPDARAVADKIALNTGISVPDLSPEASVFFRETFAMRNE